MSTGTEQRKLAAIMFTDMVGYSALSQRNEELALELLEEHRRIVRGLLPRHGGREVKTTGDGFLLEFPSALAAVQGAVEIQSALHERNQVSPPEGQLRIRIGIHIGDVVMKDGDIHGDGVNIAARIEPLAAAGGICISSAVHEQVRNKLSRPMAALGPAELKNIEMPVVVHRVVMPWETERKPEIRPAATARQRGENPKSEIGKGLPTSVRAKWSFIAALILFAGGIVWWSQHNRSTKQLTQKPGVSITSLAVKPLDDFSGDTNNAYLSDGMTEALCAALGNLSGLRVPGRSSVMRYKGGQKSIQEMATELHVEAIVEGSVQRAASNLLVTVQLIEAAIDRHLWATNYQRDLSDFFKVQNEVAQAIAAEIRVRMSPQEEARLARAPWVDPAALEAYLRGRFQLARATKEGLEQSLASFSEVLRIDPKFAKAYAGVADAYVLGAGWWVEDSVVLSLGFQAATNAVALDPHAPEAHSSLGWYQMMSWRWPAAEESFKTALELNPRYPRALNGYGWLNLHTGHSEAGLRLLLQAQESDPGFVTFASDVAWACIPLGRYDMAAIYLDKAFNLEPDFWLAQGLRGLMLAFQGNYPEAILWTEKAVQNSQGNDEMLGNLGWIYGRAGDSTKARAVLQKLRTGAKPEPSHPVMLAWVYLGLDQKEEAIKQLQEAVRKRDTFLMFLRFDRRLDPLRQDARFQEITKRVGLDK